MNQDKQQPIRVSASGDVEVGAYLEIAQAEQAKTDERASMVRTETVIIVDYGSQYSRLIARRVREANVFCELVEPDSSEDVLKSQNVKGIILSGGPESVFEANSPKAQSWIFGAGIPVLGICYGMQLMADTLGGKVLAGAKREYGHAVIQWGANDEPLSDGLDSEMTVWMSHGDRVESLPPGFKSIAFSDNSPTAAMRGGDFYGLQFHPEVTHTNNGERLIKNFLFNVCGCSGNWTPRNFLDGTVENIKAQVKGGSVLCALSGGVDSAVAAALIHKAIGDRLTCVFVDNGLLRIGEADRVMKALGGLGLNIRKLNETETFLSALRGVTNPEEKRIIIGRTFIKLFEREKETMPNADYLAQGTLYPDVIESKTSDNSASHKIKTHHNVGGLPDQMNLKLVEPLRYLFKDEVRRVGLELGLPTHILQRQPFPGPGLAIRIIGEVTEEKLATVRECDWIVLEEIKKARLYEELWQAFAVLTDAQTVGVMGDRRTYSHVVAIRAVKSTDAMTADWARLPYEILAKISSRIVNEVSAVNRVVYDITSKPPGTIEWE